MLQAIQQAMQQAVQGEAHGRMAIENAERQNLARLDIDAQKSGGPKETLARMHADQTPSRGGGGSPAADQQTPQTGSTGKKDDRRGAICYHHKRGFCKYGASCRYVHDTTDPCTMVLIRGLPYSTSEQEIIHFLAPNAIQSVTLVRSTEGQFNGTAFVEMESRMAASLVIKMFDCKFFNKDRYVLIFPSSRREREEAMANPLPFPCTPGPSRRSDGQPGAPPVAAVTSAAKARSGGRVGHQPGSVSSWTPQSASPQPMPPHCRLPPPVPPPVVLATERAPHPTESEAEVYSALLSHQQSIINQQREQLAQLGAAIARVGTPSMHPTMPMSTGFHTARTGFHTDPAAFASPGYASPAPMGVCAPPVLGELPLQQHHRLAPSVPQGLCGVQPPVLPSPGPVPPCPRTGLPEDALVARSLQLDDFEESPSRGGSLRRFQAEGMGLSQLVPNAGLGQAQGAQLQAMLWHRMRSSKRGPTPPFRSSNGRPAPGLNVAPFDEVADDLPPDLLAA